MLAWSVERGLVHEIKGYVSGSCHVDDGVGGIYLSVAALGGEDAAEMDALVGVAHGMSHDGEL